MSGIATRAIQAEWTKLRSVRSTRWTTLVLVGVTVGLTAFLAAVGSTDANRAGGTPGDDDVLVNSLRGIWLGQVAMVAFGALAATSEFASGTIRTTFTAIPRRIVAFGAKVGVVGGVALGIGSAASVLSFLLAQPLLHEGGYVAPAYPAVSLLDALAFRAVAGSAMYMTLLALFAVGVATIVRHPATAMTVAVALVLVPTVVMEFFTGTLRELLQQVAPSAGLAIQITTARYDTPRLGPWGGLGVTAGWAAAALLVAAWTIGRRDV
jgi:ABC-2 type transport system permease protein